MEQHQHRSIYSPIMWTHLFFAYELVRSVRLKEYTLALLGGPTMILSWFYHRSKKKTCQPIEHYLAKLTQMYITVQSIKFKKNRTQVWMLQFITFMVWLSEGWTGYYEEQHSWVHILAALVVHKYLDAVKNNIKT